MMMTSFRRVIIVVLGILVIAGLWWYRSRAPVVSLPKIFTIGIVVRGESYRPGVEGFIQKMKESGYEDGVNVRYTILFVEKREELSNVIRRLIDEGVDLIHTYSTPVTVEAYEQTKTIPIVFGSMGDPLASKTILSLQNSGTNVTGVSSLSSPLAAKRLEFLLEAAPTVKRVAIPFTADDIPGLSSYHTAQEAAEKLGVTLVPYYISAERPVGETALAITRRDVDGIVISSDSAVWANLEKYVEQAIKEKLPFSVFDKDMVVKGGLLGYGPDYFVSGGQSAVLVDKILKGQRPTDLPIEVPQKLLLVVNLKIARAIGITLPPALLERANLIIE